MAKTRRNKINKNVSKLLAVTRLTLYKIVFNNLPWDVLKPVRSAYAMHPLSPARKKTLGLYDESRLI